MITINQNENQLISLSNNTNNDININQNENQLLTINNTNTNSIDINQNENQLLYIDGGGNIIGISDVLVNGVSVISNNIAYVIVPTKTSELTNDSGFITSESDPTVPSYIKAITLADINNWNNKQNELVSGTNIKTINNTSILGSGNIEIDGTEYSAGTGINITSNVISNTITDYEDLNNLPTIPTKTSDLLNDSNFVDSNNLSAVAFSGSYADLSNTPEIPEFTSELTNDSGFIDNTVNDLTNYTLSSNLSTVATSGDYDDLLNKPSLSTVATTGDYTDLTNKPTIPTVNDGTLTIQENGTTLDTFTANSSSNKTVNINVPDDAIEESGSNTNGKYIKFKDGTMICYVTQNVSATINTAWGNMYYANIGSFDYPNAFISRPSIQANCSGSSTAIVVNWGASASVTTKTPNYSLLRPNTSGSNTYDVDIIAIGKWK